MPRWQEASLKRRLRLAIKQVVGRQPLSGRAAVRSGLHPGFAPLQFSILPRGRSVVCVRGPGGRGSGLTRRAVLL